MLFENFHFDSQQRKLINDIAQNDTFVCFAYMIINPRIAAALSSGQETMDVMKSERLMLDTYQVKLPAFKADQEY